MQRHVSMTMLDVGDKASGPGSGSQPIWLVHERDAMRGGGVLAVRLTRVWVERRRGSAGSQLHVRLVMLFSASYAVGSYRFDDPYTYIRPQALFAAVGLVAMWAG